MKRPETVQTEKLEKPKMKKTAVLSRLLPYLMRYKFLMLGAILLTVGGNLLSLAGPYISGLAVDAMELGRGKVNFEKVGCYGVLMVVMYAISAALSYALTRLMIVISRRVVNTMRHDVFQKLSELPVGYFDTHQTGDILSACAGVCFHRTAFDVHDEEDHGLYAAAVPQAFCKAGRAERLCGGNDQRAEDAARV